MIESGIRGRPQINTRKRRPQSYVRGRDPWSRRPSSVRFSSPGVLFYSQEIKLRNFGREDKCKNDKH